MKMPTVSRREFFRLSAAAATSATVLPGWSPTKSGGDELSPEAVEIASGGNSVFSLDQLPDPMKRTLGRTGFEVTTLGLGGQSSLQWTPPDVDPVSIILKAFEMGINHCDSANQYGDSQLNFGKAFQRMNLIPGKPGYDLRRRESLFITSKTHMRWAKPGFPELENVRNTSQGEDVECAIDDLRRSLSQMFGDGKGGYPEGAYLDLFLAHNLNHVEEVEVMYRGLETPLNKEENFGMLVGLRDYRDGTNLTGLNPKKEKLIRHLGLSGHSNSPAMMNMIRRDTYGILDAMLVTINANDRLYLNHQHNVIPVAQAKNMGIIGMKVFADGVMYGKYADWTQDYRGVIRTVGDPELPSKPLVEYTLTTPGIETAIIGIGQTSDDHLKCQLVQNYYAAQIEPDGLSAQERLKIEDLTSRRPKPGKSGNRPECGGKTNWFQLENIGLTAPGNIRVQVEGKIELSWDTAYADREPISRYEVFRDGEKIASVDHRPQTTQDPFRFTDSGKGKVYRVVTVDAAGNRSESEDIPLA